MHKIFVLKFVSYEKTKEICEFQNKLVASLKGDHDFIIVLNITVLVKSQKYVFALVVSNFCRSHILFWL